MANTGFRGVDVRQSGDRIVFRASLKDVNGAKVTSGTANLFVYELQSDGTLKSLDFNDFTFKTGALTTASVALTHRTGNNSTKNTGVWTYALTNLTGLTKNAVYLAQVEHTSAMPPEQEREFQFGNVEGDQLPDELAVITDAVTDVAPAAGSFKGSTSLSSSDTFYISAVVAFTSGTLKGLAKKVAGYTGSTRLLAFASAFPSAPANGDTFVILGHID